MCKSSVLLFCQWQRNLIPNREVGRTVTLHLKALQKDKPYSKKNWAAMGCEFLPFRYLSYVILDIVADES